MWRVISLISLVPYEKNSVVLRLGNYLWFIRRLLFKTAPPNLSVIWLATSFYAMITLYNFTASTIDYCNFLQLLTVAVVIYNYGCSNRCGSTRRVWRFPSLPACLLHLFEKLVGVAVCKHRLRCFAFAKEGLIHGLHYDWLNCRPALHQCTCPLSIRHLCYVHSVCTCIWSFTARSQRWWESKNVTGSFLLRHTTASFCQQQVCFHPIWFNGIETRNLALVLHTRLQ